VQRKVNLSLLTISVGQKSYQVTRFSTVSAVLNHNMTNTTMIIPNAIVEPAYVDPLSTELPDTCVVDGFRLEVKVEPGIDADAVEVVGAGVIVTMAVPVAVGASFMSAVERNPFRFLMVLDGILPAADFQGMSPVALCHSI
jgi:hypothetical protein